jgi:DNA primase
MKENKSLKMELEQSLDARALELQNAIRILENQLKAMRLMNEHLDKENSQYAVIKSAVDTNNVNLLLDLSHKVINNTLENRQLKIENTIITDSLSNIKTHFENLELELFQKVIDKKVEEQYFIDSILTKFCTVDTVFLPLDTLRVDSLLNMDTLRQELPKLETE